MATAVKFISLGLLIVVFLLPTDGVDGASECYTCAETLKPNTDFQRLCRDIYQVESKLAEPCSPGSSCYKFFFTSKTSSNAFARGCIAKGQDFVASDLPFDLPPNAYARLLKVVYSEGRAESCVRLNETDRGRGETLACFCEKSLCNSAEHFQDWSLPRLLILFIGILSSFWSQ